MSMAYDEFSKFALGFEPVVSKAVQSAVRACIFNMFKHVKPSGFSIWSANQAVLRCPLTTSPGQYFTMEKPPITSKAVALVDHDIIRECNDVVDGLREQADFDRPLFPFAFTSCLKEEVRKYGRNARGFASGGLHLYLTKQMFFGDLFDSLVDVNGGKHPTLRPSDTWYFPGRHQFNGGWNDLASELLSVSSDKGSVFSYDFTGWDRSVSNYWTDEVLNLCNLLYFGASSSYASDCKVRGLLHRAMSHGLVLLEDGTLLGTHYGVKSGDVSTTAFNTLAHIFLMHTACIEVGVRAGLPIDDVLASFQKGIVFRCAGDDGIGSFNPSVVPWFSIDRLRDVLKEYGFVFKQINCITAESFKRPTPGTPIIDFCSKQFRYVHGVFVAKPDRLKMRCKYTYGGNSHDPKDVFARLCSYRTESYGDPILFEEFDRYSQRFYNCHQPRLRDDRPGDTNTYASLMASYATPAELYMKWYGFEKSFPKFRTSGS